MPELGYLVGFVAFIVTINLIGLFGYSSIGLSQEFVGPPQLNISAYEPPPDVVPSEEEDALDALVDYILNLLYLLVYVIEAVLETTIFVGSFAIYLLSFQSLAVFGVPLIWRASLAAIMNTGLIVSIIKLVRG